MPELLSLDSNLLINLEDDEDLDEEITQDRLLYDPDKINIATREPTLEQLLRRVGENAFRKNPKARKPPIDQSLFESWMTIISNLVDDEIEILFERKQKLIELFSRRMEPDPKFSKSISQVADLVEYRFEIIDAVVKEVLK